MKARGTRKQLVAPLAAVAVCTLLLSLPGCKIVRRDQQLSGSPAVSENFDPAAYVAAVWEPRVVPLFKDSAADIGTVLALLKQDPDIAGQRFGHRPDVEGSAWNFAVTGKGRITALNTESKAGTIVLQLDSGQSVTLQIGPVVRGSAIRDVLPFFSFKDVTNQIEFSQVSRTLNDRALADVRSALTTPPAVGATVEFHGAFTYTSPENILITPSALKIRAP